MIYVECAPDEVLVRTLAGLESRDVRHELGKDKVVNRVSRGRNARALIDEDPLAVQHPYLMNMPILQDEPGRGLRLLGDHRGNQIIVLCPKLEDWIVRAARDADTDLASFNLPGDPRALHGVINERLSSFQRLVEDLRNTERLGALRGLLSL